MERVVLKRRGGLNSAGLEQFEVWVGEQRIEGVRGYEIKEHAKAIPVVTLHIECSELIEELEFDSAEITFKGVRDADSEGQRRLEDRQHSGGVEDQGSSAA